MSSYHALEFEITEAGGIIARCRCSWKSADYRFMREAESAWIMHLYLTAYELRVKANGGLRD